jgi:UDP-N-acetylmuramoylalanine--D-glutamate ligase
MRVLVIGLAATGEALVRHLVARGDDVTVVEDTPGSGDEYASRAREARRLGAELVEGPESTTLEELVASVDLVVPSPGVPEHHVALAAARRTAVPVRSEIDLAADATFPGRDGGRPVLCAITGTNGKTTVTTLTTEMLQAAGIKVAAAGNIGRPLLEAVNDDVDVVVAEVSSFQLAFTEVFRPRVAALLNVGADHLDWHRTFDAYAQAKAKIFTRQRPDDLLVFNADDPVVAGLAAGAPGRRVPFSVTPGAAVGYRIAETVAGRLLVTPAGAELAPVDSLPRHSVPDLANALAAAALALDLGADIEAVRSTLASFDGLAHRMQPVIEHDGVRYIDDSKATNPHATVASLRGLQDVVLIAGGRNKSLDLRELAVLAPRLRAVVAMGEAADDVADAFAGRVPVVRADSMHEVVRAAADVARPGDAVILSPACASFDAYPSYAARGDDFAREVRELVEVTG